MPKIRLAIFVGIVWPLLNGWPAQAEVKIALLNDNFTFNVTVKKNYLYVTQEGGNLKSVTPVLLDLRSIGEEVPAPPDALTFEIATQVGNVWKIPLKMTPELLPKAGQYRATIQIAAEIESGGAVKEITKFIQLVRPATEFQVGDATKPQRIQLQRTLPFWGNASGSATLTIHPETDSSAAPKIGSGDVYSSIGSNPYRIGEASLNRLREDRS